MKKIAYSNLHDNITILFEQYQISYVIRDKVFNFFMKCINMLEISTIYVVGSLAKGNFASINQNGFWYPFSDFDFLIIVNSINNEKTESIYVEAERLSERISPNQKSFHMGIKIRSLEETKVLKPIYKNDWIQYGKLIFGEDIRLADNHPNINKQIKVVDVIDSRLKYICLYTLNRIKIPCDKERSFNKSYQTYNILKLSTNIIDCINLNNEEMQHFSDTEIDYIYRVAQKLEKFKINPSSYIVELDDLNEMSLVKIILRKFIQISNKENFSTIFLFVIYILQLRNIFFKGIFFKVRNQVVNRMLLSNMFEHREHNIHYRRLLNQNIHTKIG